MLISCGHLQCCFCIYVEVSQRLSPTFKHIQMSCFDANCFDVKFCPIHQSTTHCFDTIMSFMGAQGSYLVAIRNEKISGYVLERLQGHYLAVYFFHSVKQAIKEFSMFGQFNVVRLSRTPGSNSVNRNPENCHIYPNSNPEHK